MEGPSYLPRNKHEWIVWVTLFVSGAFAGRIVTVFSYRFAHNLHERSQQN